MSSTVSHTHLEEQLLVDSNERSASDLICCHLFEVSSCLVSMHCHCTVFQFMHLHISVDCTCAFWRLWLYGTLWHGMWYMITTLTKEPNTSIIRVEETSYECRLCYGSDSYSLSCHHWGPGQSTSALWWTKWHWGRFFSEYCTSVLPHQYHSTSTL